MSWMLIWPMDALRKDCDSSLFFFSPCGSALVRENGRKWRVVCMNSFFPLLFLSTSFNIILSLVYSHTQQKWIVPQADLVSISANPVWENKPMRCADTAAWSHNHLQNVNRMQVDRRPVSDKPHVVTRAFAFSSVLLQMSDHNLLYPV